MNQEEFERRFEELTDYPPLPWQTRLYFEYFDQGRVPEAVDIPTGLGKTAVAVLWLIAVRAGRKLPRRLIYIVDRRAVVDQATRFVEKLREKDNQPLPISTLRGQHADNREWLDDPAQPAIVIGTVDMIGSRLLFGGYGVSRKMRPYHAGLLGTDTLFVLDEAHLVPPFERLLRDIKDKRDAANLGAADEADRELLPKLCVISLSATGRTPPVTHSESTPKVFALIDADIKDASGAASALTSRRLHAKKTLYLNTCKHGERVETLANQAWDIAEADMKSGRYLIFCHARKDAEAVQKALKEKIGKALKENIKAADSGEGPQPEAASPETELFVGGRRGYERQAAERRLTKLGFITADQSETDDEAEEKNNARFLIATSAGEVGVDMDADHMVCDLVAWDRMVQRLGRVNRRGDGNAQVYVYDTGSLDAKSNETDLAPSQDMLRQTRGLIENLPPMESGYDASPDAIRKLKHRTDAATIAKAFTPVPLRPAITRPLLDAWAMTSLREHTGRPEVAPWLRGWVDDEPQTAIVWRAHLPVPTDTEERRRRWEREAGKYFEAAPPHLLEKLETETYRAADWLAARVKKRHKSALAEKHAREKSEKANEEAWIPEQIVAMTLNAAGDLDKTFSLQALYDLDKKRLHRELVAKTLVVDGKLGGLNDGMLEPRHDGAPNWLADELRAPSDKKEPIIAWCVESEERRLEKDDAEQKNVTQEPFKDWRRIHRFILRRTPKIEESLQVLKYKQAHSTEEARSVDKKQSLEAHQECAAQEATALANNLELPKRYAKLLALAARLHDEGKRAERWQRAFRAPNDDVYAKTEGPVNPSLLDGYRHEFGSLPYAEQDDEFKTLPQDDQDIVLHLIAAHHGNARPTIRIEGCDHAPPSQLKEQACEVALRFERLQRRWGPWGLAWWETLLRAADQKASKQNQAKG